jgi:hypothetical protein
MSANFHEEKTYVVSWNDKKKCDAKYSTDGASNLFSSKVAKICFFPLNFVWT